MKQDGTSKQFLLKTTVDYPIQCQNMATKPNVHYLICLAGDGLHPVIINIATDQVTSEIIPVPVQIVRVGILTEDVFYLLTKNVEMIFYVANSTIANLGRYALRRDTDFMVSSATTDINFVCNDNRNNLRVALTFIFICGVLIMVFAYMYTRPSPM